MRLDIIIIGAGPGGYESAIAAVKEGRSVLLIESNSIGGTCLNEGCIPTKCFCRNAEVFDLVKDSEKWGIITSEPQINISAVVRRKNDVVTQLAMGIEGLLKSPYLEIIHGKAYFVNSHTVRVGETEYTAPYILIATGSVSKILPVCGVDGPGIVTSKEILDLEKLPHNLCIIGGGVIGLEFASIYNSFGCEVTVVEYAKEVIPSFDRDIAKRLRLSLKRQGVTFVLGATVTAIDTGADGVKIVHYCSGIKENAVIADLVLMAVGRTPNVEGLQLDAAGIFYNQRGIVVDENLQTNIPGVYAIGDVNGLCPLAHAATAQGKYVLAHINGDIIKPDLTKIPAVVFTRPEVASVGLTEEMAKAQGLKYTTCKNFYRANGKSLSMGNEEGIVKVLVDEDNQLLGAHILGPHAADLIHELALAMHSKISLFEVETLVHAHPSLSELLQGLM